MSVKSLAQAPGAPGSPPLELDEGALALQERARRFAENVLLPLEEEAERRDGRLPDEVVAKVKREAIEAGLNGGLHAREHGGQGWTRPEWGLGGGQYGPAPKPPPSPVPDANKHLGHAHPAPN